MACLLMEQFAQSRAVGKFPLSDTNQSVGASFFKIFQETHFHPWIFGVNFSSVSVVLVFRAHF